MSSLDKDKGNILLGAGGTIRQQISTIKEENISQVTTTLNSRFQSYTLAYCICSDYSSIFV